MISTFQALAVAILALLPGASYTFAYERLVGSFGISFSDRFVRFLAASAIFHGVFSGVELALYREFVDGGLDGLHPALFEVMVLAYVLIPTAAGSLVGYGRPLRHCRVAGSRSPAEEVLCLRVPRGG